MEGVRKKTVAGGYGLDDFIFPTSKPKEEPRQEEGPKQEQAAATANVSSIANAKSVGITNKRGTVKLNIQVEAGHHEWLNRTAKTIRDNQMAVSDNSTVVGDRVFPVHVVNLIIAYARHEGLSFTDANDLDEAYRKLGISPKEREKLEGSSVG